MKRFAYSLITLIGLSIFACGNPGLEAQLEETQAALEAAEARLDAMQTPENIFVHTVFFWMKEDLSEAERKQFLAGLNSLREVDTVERLWIGEPAGTPREVVDNSYDYALIIHFADREAQDAYQVSEIHEQFVGENQTLWTRVQVYDTLTE